MNVLALADSLELLGREAMAPVVQRWLAHYRPLYFPLTTMAPTPVLRDPAACAFLRLPRKAA